jgi:hypothetical protein
MRSIEIAASLAVMSLVACGGGGSEEKRTYLACGTSEACLEMRSDVPAEMSCTAPEVPSCSTQGVLGTCQEDQFVLHLAMYVYDAASLAEAQLECQQQGGSWIPAAPAAP